jgi:AraC-like DNA-binding protein
MEAHHDCPAASGLPGLNRTFAVKKNPAGTPMPAHRMKVSGPGEVRIGPVLALPAVLAERGVAPERAFARAGVDLKLFEDPESRIPFEALGRLLGVCVQLTGCAHFGLPVGERFDLRGFGPLGQLMRHCPTVGEALHSLLQHLQLQDRGAAPLLLRIETDCVVLGYSIYRHGTPADAQIYDGAVAIAHRLMAELCGPSWRPLRVQFSHGRPHSKDAYRRVFGPQVAFDAEVSGIVFDASWLDRPIEGADATLRELLANAIRAALGVGSIPFVDEVQGVLHQMVLSGTATGAAVARLFGIHERTLRRRLSEQGVNLQQLINRTRFELARQLPRNTGLSVAEIASALHYGDANAFSRAMRAWARASPTQWRRQRPRCQGIEPWP